MELACRSYAGTSSAVDASESFFLYYNNSSSAECTGEQIEFFFFFGVLVTLDHKIYSNLSNK